MTTFSHFLGLGLALSVAAGGCRMPQGGAGEPRAGAPGTGVKAGSTETSTEAGTAAAKGGDKSAAGRPPAGQATTAPAPSTTTVYYPNGVREGAVLALKKEGPGGEAAVGVPFDYRITVTNVSPNPVQGVRVTETLDAAYNLAAAVPAGSRAGATLTFELGTLAPNDATVITLTGKGMKAGAITNCTSVVYSIASCLTVTVTQPSLTVATTFTPSDVLSCDEIKVKVVVSNPGTGVARDVKMTDNLPAGLTTADGKNAVTFDFGDLDPGRNKEHTFTVKAGRAGTFTNEVNSTAAGGLSAKSAPVSVDVKQPVVAVTAECPAGTQQLGRQGVFKYTVKNAGTVDCASATLVAVTTQGAQFVSADNGGTHAAGKVTWNLGKLAAGESKSVSATQRFVGVGPITTTATASSRCAVDATASCTTSVIGVPDIGSMLSDDEGVTPVGANQVYRCRVENQGQVDLTDVKVVALWPAELQFVAHAAAAQATPTGNSITWGLGVLKAKQKVEWTFTLKATKAGEYVIRTTTSAKEIKNKIEQNEITTFVD